MGGNTTPREDKTRSYNWLSDFVANLPFVSKNKDQEDAFRKTSRWSHHHLKNGALDWYSYDMKQMAMLLDREHRYKDKAKALMVAFYIDLSGIGHAPFVDRSLVCMMKSAVKKSGMDVYELRDLYLDVVRSDITPRHIMSVSDSLYLLELSLEGRDCEVGGIIQKIYQEKQCRIGEAENKKG